jgi:hypothetical protein
MAQERVEGFIRQKVAQARERLRGIYYPEEKRVDQRQRRGTIFPSAEQHAASDPFAQYAEALTQDAIARMDVSAIQFGAHTNKIVTLANAGYDITTIRQLLPDTTFSVPPLIPSAPDPNAEETQHPTPQQQEEIEQREQRRQHLLGQLREQQPALYDRLQQIDSDTEGKVSQVKQAFFRKLADNPWVAPYAPEEKDTQNT